MTAASGKNAYDYSGTNLLKLRKELFKAPVEICIERAALITDYMKNKAPKDEKEKTPQIFRAKAIAHYLSNKKPEFFGENLLAGTTGSKFKSALLFPEFIGLTIWSELDTISTRAKNPQLLTAKEAETLNLEVFPYWLDKDVLSTTKRYIKEKKLDEIPLKLLEKLIFYLSGKGSCISHTVPMFERVLEEGLNTIITEADQKAKSAQKAESKEFYTAVGIVLRGLLKYAENLSKAAEAEAKKAKDAGNEKARERFERMAKVCKNFYHTENPQLPNPASGLYEAVSRIWLCMIGIHAENMNMAISPGRLDQILHRYYRADKDSGKLTDVEAAEIIGNLFLKLGDNVNLVPKVSEDLFGGTGTSPSVTVGGVDGKGEDAVNELTYIMLNVTEYLSLREPNMNARYFPGVNTIEYRNRVAEVISNTEAIPAFYNDAAIIKTLENQGVPAEHARDYAIIGCVEFSVSGRSYDASSDVLLNLAAPLEMALYNGRRSKDGEQFGAPKTGDPAAFKSYNDFWEAFKTQLSWIIKQAVAMSEQFAVIHEKIAPSPLLSALFDGPLNKGIDLVSGGAVYNSSGATHAGFADVVDSLNAIKCAFEDGKYTMKDIVNAVEKNFKGEDEARLHSYLLRKTRKYGTAEETAGGSGISCELVKLMHETYQGYTNNRGGKYRSSFWSMTNHSGQGKITHALPNGRKAGEFFASGITPAAGSSRYLTECLNAVAALGGDNMPGGIALNIKFMRLKKEDIENFCAFIEGYFKNGGLQVQFNVMSNDKLRKALNDKTGKYDDLLVRVSGYSAYFKDLTDHMKDELIKRAEYNVQNGRWVE